MNDGPVNEEKPEDIETSQEPEQVMDEQTGKQGASVSIRTKSSSGFAFSAEDVAEEKVEHAKNLKARSLQNKKTPVFLVVILVIALAIVVLSVGILIFQFMKQLERADKNFKDEMKIIDKEKRLEKIEKKKKDEEKKEKKKKKKKKKSKKKKKKKKSSSKKSSKKKKTDDKKADSDKKSEKEDD